MMLAFVVAAGCARVAWAVKVLGYGDSLTAGQYACRRFEGRGIECDFAPYAVHTEGWLASSSRLPERHQVLSSGLCGWTARAMVDHAWNDARLRDGVVLGHVVDAAPFAARVGLCATLEAHRAFGDPVDVVVLLAGTNDLMDEAADVAATVAAVWALHENAHALGARTLALAVPPCASCSAGFEARRREANARLRARANAARNAAYAWRCRYLAWPEAEFGDAPVPLFADDGLHLSPAGSRALGEWLGNAVLDSLRFWRCDEPPQNEGKYVVALPVTRDGVDALVAGEDARAVAAALLAENAPATIDGCGDAACVEARVAAALASRAVSRKPPRKPGVFGLWRPIFRFV